MRISDWSSDVCSSDLSLRRAAYTKSIDGTGGTGNAAGNQGWGLLFVNAGLEPERPLEAQKDSFWWGGSGFAALDRPYRGYRRVVRGFCPQHPGLDLRSEEHTSELQSLMRISYAGFFMKKNKTNNTHII